MSGHLSPDGRYYWDGARWVNAMSPDGAWRWDGGQWQPARSATQANARMAMLVALGVIAALLVVGFGAFTLWRVAVSEPSAFAGLRLACTGASAQAGSGVAAGGSVCGYRLGPAQILGSCTEGGGTPPGLRVWRQGSHDASAAPADVAVDSSGCDLSTQAGDSVWLESATVEPPGIVAIADYTAETDWGLLGINLACTLQSCVSLTIDPAGVYRLDEKQGQGNWKNVARGALPLFTISRLGPLNRLVMRYHDRAIQVFLNGYPVVRASTGLLQTPGRVSFWADDKSPTDAAIVHVRMFDVFASV